MSLAPEDVRVVDVGLDRQPAAARGQRLPRGADERSQWLDVMEHVDGIGQIHRPRKRLLDEVPDRERQVRPPVPGTGMIDHLGLDVDAEELDPGVVLGQARDKRAGAAADLQDAARGTDVAPDGGRHHLEPAALQVAFSARLVLRCGERVVVVHRA